MPIDPRDIFGIKNAASKDVSQESRENLEKNLFRGEQIYFVTHQLTKRTLAISVHTAERGI